MNRRLTEWVALVALFALLVVLALSTMRPPPSTYSSMDTGPNGYRALYEVLRREGLEVSRLEQPLAELDPATRVLVVTPPLPAFGSPLPIVYDTADRARIKRFIKRGGFVVAFGAVTGMEHVRGIRVLNVNGWTNAALARDPSSAATVYRLVAGRGPIAFDERLHGYDRTRSLWDVLPLPVRLAVCIVAFAVLLALVDGNVRFAPPVTIEPPADRDSSDYVRSMARLLRRARAGSAAIERFANAYPGDAELRELAAQSRPTAAAVFRAAVVYSTRRKERR